MSDLAGFAQFTAAGAGLIALSAIVTTFFTYLNGSRSDDHDTAEREKLQVKERDLLADDELRLIKLWSVNQERLGLYHGIAIKQARLSFLSTQVAATVGLAGVVAVAIFAATTDSQTGAIAASVIGVAGAGLSGYVGSTFMAAQKDASAQLTAYFNQPVEFARLLAAERLLVDVPADKRADILAALVPAIVNPTGPAA